MRNIIQNNMDPCSGADLNMLVVVSDMLSSIFKHMIEEDVVTKKVMTKWLHEHDICFARNADTIGGIYSSLVELKAPLSDFDPVKELELLQGMFVGLNTEDVPQREILIQQIFIKQAELERATGKIINIEESGVLTLIDPTNEEDE